MQDVLNSLVPITQFNRGQASRIFNRLHDEDKLIVLKNNKPTAVILSPKEYERLSEIEKDYELLLEATERLENNDKPTVSMENVMTELGITQDEIDHAQEPVID